jgi:hypothetical protein
MALRIACLDGWRRQRALIRTGRKSTMARINEPGSGHGNMTSPAGNHYWEYSNDISLKMLKQAIWIIDNRVKGMRACNDCFKRLPSGRSFDDVWADNSVWINYDERTDRDWYGITLGFDISISQSAFKKGRWWVAGTLVHELAHIDGAPSNTAAADETLLHCGLKNAYEGVIGIRDVASPDQIA